MSLISGFHHVSLIVADTGRALSFYQGLLGLDIDPDRPALDFPGAWLRVGPHQIHLLELPNPDPVQGRPVHGGRDRHLALTVADLDLLMRRLEDAGINYRLSRSGRRAIFVRDPDANALELIEWRQSHQPL